MHGRSALSLFIRIDPGSGAGLQQQIYDGVRRAILQGAAAPGARLPSSRSLAADLGVSRTTAVLALDQLVSEGYVTPRRGSGMFVAEELPDDPLDPGSAPSTAPRHPPFSRRSTALSAIPPPARRLPAGPARPFRIGTPALELFPVGLWSRLASRRQRSLTAAQLDYGEPAGLPALREAIAAHVQAARGTRCDAGQVHVVAGAQRALDLVCRLLLDPGDEAWVEEPGYPGAWSALLSAGARIVPVPVDAEGIDASAAAGRARVFYVTPSHQFPLGMPTSLRRRLALLKRAADAGVWIVEDDYDSEFRHGARPIPCLHGLDTDGRVIYLGSFSKSVFPALRLGFLIVPPDLGELLSAARRSGAELSPPFLEQAVLADFIAGGHFERHLRRMRTVYRERLAALSAAAEGFCGGALRLRPVATGLHAIVAFLCQQRERVPLVRRTARARAALADHVLEGVAHSQWVFTLPKRLRSRGAEGSRQHAPHLRGR